jgi:hypothetical protein
LIGKHILEDNSSIGFLLGQIIEDRSIPEWRNVLCTSENKQGLVKFLGEYALKHFHEFMKDRSEIFLEVERKQ